MNKSRKQGPFGALKIESYQFETVKQKKQPLKIILFSILILLLIVSFFYTFSRYQRVTRLYDAHFLNESWIDYPDILNNHEVVNLLVLGENFENNGKIGDKRTPVWQIVSINPLKKQSLVLEISPFLLLDDTPLMEFSVDRHRKLMIDKIENIFDIHIHHLLKINLDQARSIYNQYESMIQSPLIKNDSDSVKNLNNHLKAFLMMNNEMVQEDWLNHNKKMLLILVDFWIEHWYGIIVNEAFLEINTVFSTSLSYYQLIQLMTGDYRVALSNFEDEEVDSTNINRMVIKLKENIRH